MKLKNEIIYRIDGYDRRNNKEIKLALSKALGKEIGSIYKYLRDNLDNGELTKLVALKVIEDRLGFEIDYLVE